MGFFFLFFLLNVVEQALQSLMRENWFLSFLTLRTDSHVHRGKGAFFPGVMIVFLWFESNVPRAEYKPTSILTADYTRGYIAVGILIIINNKKDEGFEF